MFSPEGCAAEALVGHDRKCVSAQLAKLLKTSVAQIEKDIGSERVPAEATAQVVMTRVCPCTSCTTAGNQGVHATDQLQ